MYYLQVHGYDLSLDPDDKTRLYVGSDDGLVIHGSTQVKVVVMTMTMTVTMTMTITMTMTMTMTMTFLLQADHRPSPRLFKPEIETSASCNSIGEKVSLIAIISHTTQPLFLPFLPSLLPLFLLYLCYSCPTFMSAIPTQPSALSPSPTCCLAPRTDPSGNSLAGIVDLTGKVLLSGL